MVGINFQKAFKRLSSIKEEKSELNFDIKIFQCNEEFSLYKCSQELKSIQVGLDFLNNKKFIILLTNSLNNFFDKVQVNSKEKKLKKNRKSFVNFLYREINNYFNFEFLIK